ncbi:MAG: prevent-host-death protein [Paludibacter sp.]|nr:prevent-host-death protein [Paludibacter sp.]
MLVISARELTQNQNKFFEIANKQRVIIKRKNRFFQIVDLGEMIPELDDTYMTKEEMFAKIDEGIAEYKAGKTKTLSSKEEVHDFLNSL